MMVEEEGFQVPPHDIEAEKRALGCALSGVIGLDVVVSLLEKGHYYIRAHGTIHSALVDLQVQNKGADVVTVADRLRDLGALDDCGGTSYLQSLSSGDHNTDLAESYCAIVSDKHLMRKMLELPAFITKMVQGTSQSAAEIRDQVEQVVFAMSPVKRSSKEYSAFDLASSFMDRQFGDRPEQEKEVGGSTGINGLDRILKHLRPGTFSIIAGRPNMGKSALLNTVALQTAETYGPVVLFSNEMLAGDIFDRMVACASRVHLDKIQERRLDDEEMSRVAANIGRLGDLPLEIVECSGMSILDIKTTIRRYQRLGKCDFAAVDYLQKVKPHVRAGTREQEVSAMSAECSNIAKECKIAFVALCQLNRAVEKQADKRPGLTDIRESGSLEQDADAVVFPYRPKYYTRATDDAPVNTDADSFMEAAEMIVAKNRFGRCGTIHAGFIEAFGAFVDPEYDLVDAPPVAPVPADLAIPPEAVDYDPFTGEVI